MIKGANKDVLRQIVCRIRATCVDSVEDFQRTASILSAYDQFSNYQTEPLAHRFITHNQEVSQKNLSTKKILEDLIEGEDISSLMNVWETESRNQSYDWETRHGDHVNTLDRLRELGNSMYRQIDVPFVETTEYEEMRGIAQRCYERSHELFKFCQRVVEIDPEDIVASTPLELSQEIFEYVKNNDNRINILEGVRAIMYIDQENPQQGIDKIARNFASYFIDNFPTDMTKKSMVKKTLAEAQGYIGVQAQEAVA